MGRRQHVHESPRPATIEDVAALAGVSIATVSRVMNGSSAVAYATKERVGRAIAALGFHPRASARSLAKGRAMVFGLLVPEISGDFFVPMLRGIESVAAERGYGLMIGTVACGGLGLASSMIEAVDGVLLFADCADDETVAVCSAQGKASVLLYRSPPPGTALSSVTIENEAGAFAAVTHLIDTHGSHRPLLVAGPSGNHDAEDRERGYRAALSARSLVPDPGLRVEGGFSRDQAREAVARALRGGPAFDAVFAADDGSAFGVMEALAEAGLRVGIDIPVMGFDDVAAAALARPGLSTVRAPTQRLGRVAAELLLDEIDGRSARSKTRIILPTELVIRGSCGCCPTREVTT